jgi:hypothetical protein
MAFGLSGAPSTFQSVMDAMLVGLPDVEVLVYLDDLLFSETIEDHFKACTHLTNQNKPRPTNIGTPFDNILVANGLAFGVLFTLIPDLGANRLVEVRSCG